DWSSDVCSSDLAAVQGLDEVRIARLLGLSMDGPAAYLLGVRPPAKSYRDPFTTWSLTMTNRLFKRARAFARHLNRLRDRRRSSREAHLPVRRQRQSLTPRQRAAVLAKTGGRCHICGGKIRRASLWHADHILAHAH